MNWSYEDIACARGATTFPGRGIYLFSFQLEGSGTAQSSLAQPTTMQPNSHRDSVHGQKAILLYSRRTLAASSAPGDHRSTTPLAAAVA